MLYREPGTFEVCVLPGDDVCFHEMLLLMMMLMVLRPSKEQKHEGKVKLEGGFILFPCRAPLSIHASAKSRKVRRDLRPHLQ